MGNTDVFPIFVLEEMKDMAIYDELMHLYTSYSERELAKVLRIPRATLYDYKLQHYSISAYREHLIHNFYRTTVYKALRNMGVPSQVASARRNVSPATLTKTIGEFKNLIGDMVQGNIDRQRLQDSESGLSRDYDQMRIKMEESIKNSLENKDLNPEYWELYLAEIKRKIYG